MNHHTNSGGLMLMLGLSSLALQPGLLAQTASQPSENHTVKQEVSDADITVSQLVRIGKLPIEIGLGGRMYAERPEGGPDWGVKWTFTFMFAK